MSATVGLLLITVLKADPLLGLAFGRMLGMAVPILVFLRRQAAYDVVLQGLDGVFSIMLVDFEEGVGDILVDVVDERLLASWVGVDELGHVHHASLVEDDIPVVLLGVADPLLLRTMHNYIPRRPLIEALARPAPLYQPPLFGPERHR